LQAGCRPAFAHSFIVAFIKALGAGSNKLLADPDLKSKQRAEAREQRAWAARVAVNLRHDLEKLTLDVEVFLARLAGGSAHLQAESWVADQSIELLGQDALVDGLGQEAGLAFSTSGGMPPTAPTTTGKTVAVASS
jgi:hypothetical protein